MPFIDSAVVEALLENARAQIHLIDPPDFSALNLLWDAVELTQSEGHNPAVDIAVTWLDFCLCSGHGRNPPPVSFGKAVALLQTLVQHPVLAALPAPPPGEILNRYQQRASPIDTLIQHLPLASGRADAASKVAALLETKTRGMSAVQDQLNKVGTLYHSVLHTLSARHFQISFNDLNDDSQVESLTRQMQLLSASLEPTSRSRDFAWSLVWKAWTDGGVAKITIDHMVNAAVFAAPVAAVAALAPALQSETQRQLLVAWQQLLAATAAAVDDIRKQRVSIAAMCVRSRLFSLPNCC